MAVGMAGSGYRVLAINRLLALFVFPAAYMYLLGDYDKPIKLRMGIAVGGASALDVAERSASFFL